MRSILLSNFYFLICFVAFLICVAVAARANAQSLAGSDLSSSISSNGWGKGGKPKPTPTPTPAPFVDPIWLGTNSNSWTDDNNWNPAGAPTSTSDVTFSGTPTNFPDQPSGTTILHTITFDSTAASFTGLNTSGEVFALRDSASFTALTQASSNLQTINQLDVYFTAGSGVTSTINLSGTGGLTLSEGLRWGGGTLIVQGQGPLTINGTFRGDLSSAGATGGTSRAINLSGDVTSGQTVTFNPTNAAAWTGITNITLGGRVTLDIANAAAVDAGTVTFASGANDSALLITGVTSGSTFDRSISFTAGSITGGTQTIGVSGVSATFSGTISTAGTNNTIALSATSGTTATFSGVISGARPISITGGGTVTLTAADTYTGATTITSTATLKLDNNNTITPRLTGTTSITVNSGGTLLLAQGGATASTDRINDAATMTLNGGTFNTGGLSEHGASNSTAGIGALTLSSSSIINMGAGSSVIAFADSHLSSWTGTLQIWNWSGTPTTGGGTDELFFGTSSGGLTSTQLGEIQFYSDSGTTLYGGAITILSTGEVVPVPEPSTYVAAALAMAALLITQRRRFARLLKKA
jgi:autotransporter-associated beta strand protein